MRVLDANRDGHFARGAAAEPDAIVVLRGIRQTRSRLDDDPVAAINGVFGLPNC